MTIIVIDNNAHRMVEFEKLILSVFTDVQISFYESIDVTASPLLEPDILIVHRNNPEYRSILGSPSIGSYRLFFSGGYSGHFKKSDYEHHTTPNELVTALKEVKEHLQL